MNTRKFSGDMADQVEKDRDQLIEMREVMSWASENVGAISPIGANGWAVSWDRSKFTTAPTLYEALHTAWEKRDE